MNAVTHNFYDTATGCITDVDAFLAAPKAAQDRALALWANDNGRHAATFRDKIDQFHDAQVGYAFLTPQLYRIEAEVYRVKRPSFDISAFLPINTDGDMWDVGTVVYSREDVGAAEFFSGGAFDMPYASNKMLQGTRAYHLAGIGYEWNMQEMQRAAMLGRSLSSDKADAAVLAADRFIYGIAMTGKNPAGVSEKGWTGFVNDPDVPSAQVPNDGTGSSRLWSAKTPDQIARDFWAIVNAPEAATGETFRADTVVLPTSLFRYLQSTRMTDTGTTIMAYILAAQTEGERLTVLHSRALETAGTGGTTRIVAYANDKQALQFHLPAAHRFLPPFQKSSMTYEVGGIMNVGGLEWRVPKSARYGDSA